MGSDGTGVFAERQLIGLYLALCTALSISCFRLFPRFLVSLASELLFPFFPLCRISLSLTTLLSPLGLS